jgi:formylglycine-generating enzyme required for sulfatase activity
VDVRQAQQAWAKYLHRKVEETVEVAKGVNMTFVLVPPGTFLMGSSREEQDYLIKIFYQGKRPDGLDSETQHEVTLTEPFDLGKTEVTQSQFEALTGANPSWSKGGDLPVEMVSWEQARDYASALTKKRGDGHRYHLPTEAEWEHACRGGRPSSHLFDIGDGRTLSSRQANFDGDFPYGDAAKGPRLDTTCCVASYSPNAMGFFDMHGNVDEWCADWYGPYSVKPVINPTGPTNVVSHRVIRGGSCFHDGGGCRAAEPSGKPGHGSVLGFRLARSLVSGGK